MNPRRSSYSTGAGNQSISIDPNSFFQTQTQTPTSNVVASVKMFLKKPHAFPFLLFIFLLLTWVSLRLQHSASSSSVKTSSFNDQDLKWGEKKSSSAEDDHKANLIRFPSSETLSEITKDKRGWLMDPVSVALKSGIPGEFYVCLCLWIF